MYIDLVLLGIFLGDNDRFSGSLFQVKYKQDCSERGTYLTIQDTIFLTIRETTLDLYCHCLPCLLPREILVGEERLTKFLPSP